MESVLDCKQKASKVIEVLRNAADKAITNAMIAQLNDVAYKAIRKTGVQKKLDERAIKNEALYKKLEKQLKKLSENLETDKLLEQYKELIAEIGDCPMSQNNVIEAMKDGDCMCISLAISRSEATINDPSKLIIKQVIPTFMSIDSFMDSSIFNLKKNQDASGGFDYSKEGELAIGLGRESISGVLPLFLFKEHWEFAMRKIQPLFGFMCTLDPMGYASAQYFIIPFLVYLRTVVECTEANSEKNRFVRDRVLETCANMVANKNELKS